MSDFSDVAGVTVENCADLEPRMFVVNHGGGESLAPEVLRLLDPADFGTFACCLFDKSTSTELHYHDYDEPWAWTKGRALVTIRLPDGRSDEFEIGHGWVVYCVRGIEHGHQPLEDWGCYQWMSVRRPGARSGHLDREL